MPIYKPGSPQASGDNCFRILFFCFAVSMTLAGNARGQCSFVLNPSSAQATSDTTTGSFAVNASQSTCPRTASSNASWLTVTFGQTGTGNGSVGYRVDANTTYAVRSSSISVGGASFTLSQAGLPCPAASFSPTGQAVQPAGGSFSISITSPCGWTASSDSGWIVLSASSGSTSGVVSYTVAPNNTGGARSGNIQIGSGKFPVTQLSIDCTFTVSPLSVNVGVAGGVNQIGVQVSNSSCPWGVQNTTSWISNLSIGGASGPLATGNGVLSYTVAANSSPQPRTATLTVAGQTVTISQAGNICSFALSPASANVPYSATTASFGVTPSLSNCPWTAASNNSWISLTSGTKGSASGTIGYAVDTNTTTQSRSGSITVGTSTFNIAQDACGSSYSFSPVNQSVQAAGGNFSVNVATACTWSASTTAPWIAINAGSGTTGNGSLSYTVAPNNTASPRSGAIQINQQMFTVTQTGIASGGGGISFTAQSVVSGASFLSGPVAPGELISIFGSGLGPSLPVGLQTTADGRFVTSSLGGTRVLFDGVAVPLTYVSATQVNAIVPFSVAGPGSTQVVVEVQGVASNPVAEAVAAASPAIFAVSGGKGQGAILNQDNQPNSASNPAAVGSVLQVFATGFGQTNPTGSDGQIAGATASFPTQKVSATIGGIDAPVQYAGSSNGLVAGVMQVNVAIPASVQPGNSVAVVLSVGGIASTTGTTVAIVAH